MGIIKFDFLVLATLRGNSFEHFLFLFITRCEYITDYRTLLLAFGKKKTEENSWEKKKILGKGPKVDKLAHLSKL